MAVSLYSPNQQTKQQLEELDTLLQRMLALPVNGHDPAPSTPTYAAPGPEAFVPSPPTLPAPTRSVPGNDQIVQAWRVQTPATESEIVTFNGQHPPLATPVEPAPPEPRFFAAPTSGSSAPAPFPYSMVFGPQTAAAAPAMPVNNTAPRTGIPAPQWEAPTPSTELGPLPFALWPLFVLNKLFDLLTLPLGPLGSWLRQPGGRNALGWLGMLMILGAIGWGVADWYGLDWLPWK
jgi:hypothetical protein